MKHSLLILLLAFTSQTFAQQKTKAKTVKKKVEVIKYGVPDTNYIAPETTDSPQPASEIPIEVGAQFKGSFKAFLEKNFKYPMVAQEQNIQGVVIINFLVDLKGNVSDVQLAEHSPQKNIHLVNEALRIIKKSNGQWVPGKKNGKRVKSYHQQSIHFILAE